MLLIKKIKGLVKLSFIPAKFVFFEKRFYKETNLMFLIFSIEIVKIPDKNSYQ